jgi:hypothetical protein
VLAITLQARMDRTDGGRLIWGCQLEAVPAVKMYQDEVRGEHYRYDFGDVTGLFEQLYHGVLA